MAESAGESHEVHEEVTPEDRRDFLRTASSAAMAGGLLAGYGTLGVVAGRFLFPLTAGQTQWQFVATLDQLAVGESLAYIAPSGVKIVIARQGAGQTVDDFIALSSVCPHLGCQVHWESVRSRFFCPCHNGAFDAQGMPTEGPPAAGKQSLSRFPLKVEQDLLFIEIPLESLTSGTDEEGVA